MSEGTGIKSVADARYRSEKEVKVLSSKSSRTPRWGFGTRLTSWNTNSGSTAHRRDDWSEARWRSPLAVPLLLDAFARRDPGCHVHAGRIGSGERLEQEDPSSHTTRDRAHNGSQARVTVKVPGCD